MKYTTKSISALNGRAEPDVFDSTFSISAFKLVVFIQRIYHVIRLNLADPRDLQRLMRTSIISVGFFLSRYRPLWERIKV